MNNFKYIITDAVTLLLLMGAAFFIAQGVGDGAVYRVMGHVIGDSDGISATETVSNSADGDVDGQEKHLLDGSVILSRNIFSSVGDLESLSDGKDSPAPSSTIEGERSVQSCPSHKALTILSSSRPNLSTATVLYGSREIPVRVGDWLGEEQVVGIGWRYVFLEKNNADLCYLDLYGFDDVLYLPSDFLKQYVQNMYSDNRKEREGKTSGASIQI